MRKEDSGVKFIRSAVLADQINQSIDRINQSINQSVLRHSIEWPIHKLTQKSTNAEDS